MLTKEKQQSESVPISNKRVLSLDLIKLISAFMVVFYHTGHKDLGYFVEGVYHCSIEQCLLMICSSSIPMFFMVNGALLLNKDYSNEKIYNKAGKVALLVFVWSVVDFPSWFMKTLIVLYLLYPLLKKVYNKSKYRTALMTLLFVFPFCYNLGIVFLKIIAPDFSFTLFHYNISLEVIPNRTGVFTMYSVLYFMIGGICVNNDKKTKIVPCILCIIIGYLLVLLDVLVSSTYSQEIQDAVNGCFPTMGALFIAYGLFNIIRRVNILDSSKMGRLITRTNYVVLPIYLFHMQIIRYFYILFNIKEISAVVAFLLTLMICIICSLIAKVMQKIPYVKELIRI